MKKTLITGATGSLGTLIIDSLLSKNISTEGLFALVRDEEKASSIKEKGVKLRKGDYSDYASLLKAFEGMNTLFFISGSDIEARKGQHENVVNAAKEAGVKHILYTSFMRKNETETSPIAKVADAHVSTENWIKSSGMDYTILKNNLYMDMLPLFMGDQLMETGVIYQPAGDGQAAYLTRNDIADVAAHLLTTEGHENKEYDITADKAYSYNEIASLLTEITGKSIQYVSPSVEEFSQTLSEAGVPEEYIGLFASFAQATKEGEFSETSSTVENLLNRKPMSMKEYLTQVYG